MKSSSFASRSLSSRAAAVAVALALLAGCSSVQYLPDGQLGHGERLRIVERNMKGTSNGFRLLGILPLAFPSVDRAEDEILSHVDPVLRDQSQILVNRVIENRTVYFFVGSLHTITLRADLAQVEKAD